MSGLGHRASVGDCTIPVGYIMLQLPSKEQQRLGDFCLVLGLVFCLVVCFLSQDVAKAMSCSYQPVSLPG